MSKYNYDDCKAAAADVVKQLQEKFPEWNTKERRKIISIVYRTLTNQIEE
jgi:hypothetical protein